MLTAINGVEGLRRVKEKPTDDEALHEWFGRQGWIPSRRRTETRDFLRSTSIECERVMRDLRNRGRDRYWNLLVNLNSRSRSVERRH